MEAHWAGRPFCSRPKEGIMPNIIGAPTLDDALSALSAAVS